MDYAFALANGIDAAIGGVMLFSMAYWLFSDKWHLLATIAVIVAVFCAIAVVSHKGGDHSRMCDAFGTPQGC